MKKLSLLVVLIVSLSFVTKAQMNFGIKAGLNMATITGDDVTDTKLKPSYQVGAVAQFQMSDAFSIQPSLILSGKGTKDSEVDDYSMNLNYLEVPINAVYNISGFQIFAGPYLGVGLFGNINFAEEEVDVEFTGDVTEDSSMDKVQVNGFDYGFNVGAGYMLNESFQIQANYGLGLGNLNPKVNGEEPNNTVNNSVIQLSVSYFL